MDDPSPPVVSLRPLRDQRFTEFVREKNTDGSSTAAVKEIEAAFKKFGCVCVPVSDLDELDHSREVRATTWVVYRWYDGSWGVLI